MIGKYSRGISVRKSVNSDIDSLKDRLRQSDVEEIMASHGISPEEAIKESVKQKHCYTIENGHPLAIYGVTPEGQKIARIWMLSTDDMDKIKIPFLVHGKEFVVRMLCLYPYLYNYVYVKNKASIKWLEWLGARIGNPVEYGMNKELFRYFYFKKQEI